MRILLASDFYPPTPGGLEAHVQRLATALLQRGHSVAVVTSTAQPDSLPHGALIASGSTILANIPYVFQEKSRAFPPPWPDGTFRKAVRDVAVSWKPDVIHAHGWCAFSCYWPDSPPLIVTLHDHGLRCPKKSLLRKEAECVSGLGVACLNCPGDQSIIKRLPLTIALSWKARDLLDYSSKFIAVSRSVAERVKESGLAPDKISIIPNFIDLNEQGLCEESRQPTVLFVGPDSPHKGRSVAIEAFKLLPRGLAQLHLVGHGADVEFVGVHNFGYLTGQSLAQQFKKATVLVVPSIWPEPCPTVILEAMSYGLPVIGSRIGGIPDLVQDGKAGLLVPPNDPRALADAMSCLLGDQLMWHDMSLNAQASVASFSTDIIIPQIEKVYSSADQAKVVIPQLL